MPTDSIANETRELIAKQLGRSVEQITDEADLELDLGADSLDLVELSMTLEEKFEIDIDDEDTLGPLMVGEIITAIKSKVAAK